MQPDQELSQNTQYQQSLTHQFQAPLKRKPVTRWIVLMIMPVILFMVVFILSLVTMLAFKRVSTCASSSVIVKTPSSKIEQGTSGDRTNTSSMSYKTACDRNKSNKGRRIMQILQALIGLGAAGCLFLEPLWVVKLVKAIKHNSQIPKV